MLVKKARTIQNRFRTVRDIPKTKVLVHSQNYTGEVKH